eukprot:692919-Rhodomonas_salina.2
MAVALSTSPSTTYGRTAYPGPVPLNAAYGSSTYPSLVSSTAVALSTSTTAGSSTYSCSVLGVA